MSGANVRPQFPADIVNGTHDPELVVDILTQTINDVWFRILNGMSIQHETMKQSWWLYLCPFYHMLYYFEQHQDFYHVNNIHQHKLKLFTLLPIRKLIPKNVHIDETILKEILYRWFRIHNEENPWAYFNIGLAIPHEGRHGNMLLQFHGSIKTDGVKCSVLIDKVPRPRAQVNDHGFLFTDEETYVEMEQSGAYGKVVGIDTGRKVWFVAYWGKDGRCDDMADVDRNEEKLKKVVYKVGCWLEKSGSKFSNRKVAFWTQQDPEMAEFISTGITSPKTGRYDQFSGHTIRVMYNLVHLVNFYQPHKWRHGRWKKYVSFYLSELHYIHL